MVRVLASHRCGLGSIPCSEGFSLKNRHSKFQFDPRIWSSRHVKMRVTSVLFILLAWTRDEEKNLSPWWKSDPWSSAHRVGWIYADYFKNLLLESSLAPRSLVGECFVLKRFWNEVSMSVVFQTLRNSQWMLTICRVSYLSASSPESSHPNICSIGFIFSTMNCLVRKTGWTEQVSTITEPYSFALHFSPYVHMFKNCNWRFIDISWLFSVTQLILHSC